MKAVIVGIDYIPSSGEVKFLELNTNALLGGFGQLHLNVDFSRLAEYCYSKGIKKTLLHVSEHNYSITGWSGHSVKVVDSLVEEKLRKALSLYKIDFDTFVDTKWPDHLTDLSDSTTLDLRQAYSSYSKLDWFAESKERIREFLKDRGHGEWMPEIGIENVTTKPPFIPDYVAKIPNKDAQQGIRFFEKTNYIPEEGFIENFVLPDNDKWGFFCEARYTCVLTEIGDIIPLSTSDCLHLNRFTFKRKNLDDYSTKELRLGYKIPAFGIARENSNFLLEDGSTLNAHSIHLNTLSKNYNDLVAYKVDEINMSLEEYKGIEERTFTLTSNKPNILSKGSNSFIFTPKWTENCIWIDGTIVSPRAVIPTYREGGVRLVQAKDLKEGDYCLDSKLNPKPIISIRQVGVQPLIYPQPIKDMEYHRTLICNDMAIVCENQYFDILPPQKEKHNRYVVGSDLLEQELDMLNFNVENGNLFSWREYQPLVQKRSEELLKLIYDTFKEEVWVW